MIKSRRSKIWTVYSDSEFTELVSRCHTYKEIIIACGIKPKGYNNNTVKARIEYLGLNTSHFYPYYHNVSTLNRNKKTPLSDILVEQSNFNRYHLKQRLLSENILTNICSECGLSGEWNGKLLVLQLDHINGISNDNRLENLRMVCPNCHSQTDTFAGKSHKKRYYCECGSEITKHATLCNACYAKKRRTCIRPDITELITNISDLGYLQTGKKYGVSDNAIRKWIRSYGIDPKTIRNK